MSWSSFLLTLGIVYVAYYVLNIIYDLKFKPQKKKQVTSNPSILTFEETTVPLEVSDHFVEKHKEVLTDVLNNKKEVEVQPAAKLADYEEPDIKPSKVEIIPSVESGGVDIKSLFDLCRKDAILQSSKINFA